MDYVDKMEQANNAAAAAAIEAPSTFDSAESSGEVADGSTKQCQLLLGGDDDQDEANTNLP